MDPPPWGFSTTTRIFYRAQGGVATAVPTYVVLLDCMRHHIPLLGLQSTIGHGSESHVSTVVVGSLGGEKGYEGNIEILYIPALHFPPKT